MGPLKLSKWHILGCRIVLVQNLCGRKILNTGLYQHWKSLNLSKWKFMGGKNAKRGCFQIFVLMYYHAKITSYINANPTICYRNAEQCTVHLSSSTCKTSDTVPQKLWIFTLNKFIWQHKLSFIVKLTTISLDILTDLKLILEQSNY